MGRIFMTPLMMCLIGNSTTAQEVLYAFDQRTIDNSIKCELSQVARALRPYKVDPSRLKAHLDSTRSDTRNTNFGVKVGFGPWFPSTEVNRGSTDAEGSGIHGIRNIHIDNSINCRKRNVVDLGIYRCFQPYLIHYVRGDSIECSKEKTATGAANANFQVQVWVVNAGPSTGYSVTRTWKVTVAAPPK